MAKIVPDPKDVGPAEPQTENLGPAPQGKEVDLGPADKSDGLDPATLAPEYRRAFGLAEPASNLIDLGPAPQGSPADSSREVDLGSAHGEPDHTVILERVDRGNRLTQIWDAFKGGVKEGFGDAPLGFDPTGEAEKFMQKVGIFRDPSQARWGDALRHDYEATLRPAAAIADAFARVPWSIMNGIADALDADQKWSYAEVGAQPPNEFAIGPAVKSGAEFAMAGAPGTEIFSAPTRLPSGHIIDLKIGGLATHADFENAAAAIHGVPGSGTSVEIQLEHHAAVANTEDKLRNLYDQYGIHPNEVLADATRDPQLAADLGSDNPVLPPRYTGIDPVQMIRDQMNSDAAAGAPAPKIAGVTNDLNEALQTRTSWPQTKAAIDGPIASKSFGDHISDTIDRFGIGDITRQLQKNTAPMAMRDATVDSRAVAKDFANAMRVSRFDTQNTIAKLSENFSRDELKRMWEAGDEEHVALKTGVETADKGMATLEPRQRAVVEALQAKAASAWEEAKLSGVVREDAVGLESYMPRMVLNDFVQRSGAGNALDRIGMNLRTATPNLRRRKYLLAEDTEAAAKETLGEGARLVRDVRTLPLATGKLQEAIAGRKLINAVRDLGEKTGDPDAPGTVSEGSIPEGHEGNYFTIPQHPAFTTYKLRFKADELTGKMKPVMDAEGKPIFDRVPLYVRSDFEGPLRAVLSQDEGAIYRALMSLKMRATSAIMYSPLLHNSVIFGRILPTKFGNPIATGKLYFDGYRLRQNTAFMRELIENGLTPVSRGGTRADLAAFTADAGIKPGHSWTSQVLAAVPDLFDKRAGDAVRGGVDTLGHVVHDKLLWDRIADAQVAIANDYLNKQLKLGIPREAALKSATHLANRYAGALPMEEMNNTARKIANTLLFSRSFTLGTLGSLKDMFTGLPRSVLAQIERDHGVQTMMQVQSFARRKAIGIVVADMALYYAGGSLLNSAWNVLTNSGGIGQGLDDEMHNYAERMKSAWANVSSANPMSAFGMLSALDSTSDNEPGKEHRMLVGYQQDGTAIYAKVQLGRTGADMIGYLSHPAQTIFDKFSTLFRPTLDVALNQDALGRHLYNPWPDTPSAYLDTAAKIVLHYLAAQTPADTLSAIADLTTGTPTDDEKKLDVEKIVLPMFGAMISHGAAGGPAAGEFALNNKKLDYIRETALPEAAKAIKEGRYVDARKMMDKAGMDARFQKLFMRAVRNPQLKYLKRQYQKYRNGLDDVARERLDRMMQSSQQ